MSSEGKMEYLFARFVGGPEHNRHVLVQAVDVIAFPYAEKDGGPASCTVVCSPWKNVYKQAVYKRTSLCSEVNRGRRVSAMHTDEQSVTAWCEYHYVAEVEPSLQDSGGDGTSRVPMLTNKKKAKLVLQNAEIIIRLRDLQKKWGKKKSKGSAG